MSAIVEELVPCPDAWDVARAFAHMPHMVFLDSSDRHPERGQFSYVTADPVQFEQRNANDNRASCLDGFTLGNSRANRPDLPPFQGGAVGVIGYGMGREFETVPAPRNMEFPQPDWSFGIYDWVIAFDHKEERCWIISTGYRDGQTCAKRAAKRLEQVRDLWQSRGLSRVLPKLAYTPVERLATQNPLANYPGVTSNFSREQYLRAVQRAIEYVHAGDIFQVNISQRLLAPLTEHPLEVYGRLRRASPAPFACYLDLGEYQVVSASPERFLQISPSGEVVTRPIKGTRPRGKTPHDDAVLLHDLTTNPKDRAENVMIVDLLRNDLGRVCEFGSVMVPKLCEVETYNYVHHLVSEVRGQLRAGLTPMDLIRATFPGGSVTGAPKVRAMEIIAELEPTARGPYCGSAGFIGFDGAMDVNILIRTFTAGRGWLQFPVGGGIVADSDPAKEYDETMHKAAGLLKAL